MVGACPSTKATWTINTFLCGSYRPQPKRYLDLYLKLVAGIPGLEPGTY